MDQAGVHEGLTDAAADCTLMVYLMVGANARRLFLLRNYQPARFLLSRDLLPLAHLNLHIAT